MPEIARVFFRRRVGNYRRRLLRRAFRFRRRRRRKSDANVWNDGESYRDDGQFFAGQFDGRRRGRRVINANESIRLRFQRVSDKGAVGVRIADSHDDAVAVFNQDDALIADRRAVERNQAGNRYGRFG